MANPFTRGDSGPAGPWDPRNPRRSSESRQSVSSKLQNFQRYWSRNWQLNGPSITQSIVALNIVVFLIQEILKIWPDLYNSCLSYFALIPSLAYGRPWTLITSTFLHSGFMHIVMNILALYFVGRELEKLLGHWAFLGMYLVSGIGGSIFFAMWPGNGSTAVLGASGAIYGLFAAMMTVYNRIGAQTRGTMLFLFVMLFLPIFMGGVAWQAHLGGFIIGGLLSLVMMHGLPGLRSASINKRMLIYGVSFTALLFAIWLIRLVLKLSFGI